MTKDPDNEAQKTAAERAADDREKVKKFSPRDTSKMYGLKTRFPDTIHYFRTPELRDERRDAIEARYGKSENVEPKRK